MSMSAIVDGLVSLYGGINGAGGYTYDLSGSDAVKVGRYDRPPTLPFLCLNLEDVNHDPGRELPSIAPTSRWEVWGYVSVSDSTPETRAKGGYDLLDDLLRAHASNRSLNGLVGSVEVYQTNVERASAFNGQVFGLPANVGVVHAFVSVKHLQAGTV